MKRIFAIAISIAACLPAWSALPILVGHRGCDTGVENSVQAFQEGAKRGYEYLETDFKVTKDGQLICTHDDDTSRLGDETLDVASSTLEELQAVTLTQTRYGSTYTGHLCSAQEYLDVCRQYGVKPLIELKWATGINNNDCSNIPMLIKLIEDNGFRNDCIILTSMKPCLEYIRTNYPDIELQFLTGQYWANHYDWCVEWGIDVNIQATYFDKSTVRKFHDLGLKVNMWTTNTTDGYTQYGNMGCDFITTDCLDPNSLPELDADRMSGPNTIDYPEITAPVKSSYEPEKVAEYDAPLSDLTVRRAIMIDGVWHILADDADGNSSITRIDALTGTELGKVNLSGMADGTRIGDIAATADGVLLASAVATVPFNASGDESAVLKIYSWSDPDAEASVFVTVDHAAAILGNWTNSLCGEKIAASGHSLNLKLYVSTRSASASTPTYRIAGLKIERGTLVEELASYCYDTSYTADNWGDFTMTITPTSRDNLLIDSPTTQPVEYAFNWDSTRQPLTQVSQPAEGLMDSRAVGISFHRRGSKVYALIPAVDANGANYTATLYNVNDGLNDMDAISSSLHEGLGDKATTVAATAFQLTDDATYLHLFAAGQGMASFNLCAESEEEVVEDVDLELVREWILSNTTDNHPGNIDGSYAQQGTAVNGIFYVNNCSDKKIYVFNSNGLIGDMPGGAGYGCARDDAGNIVVRNDKLTGAEHSFILYPAGCTPSEPGVAIEMSATGVLEGQVNFINASGDLYNGTGHIYLYPNKQVAVSVIKVEKGVVTGVSTSDELKMTATTAGYVIPQYDNPETFLYQVRGTGVQHYDNGSITDIFNKSHSTTAPARNSTGGTAYFKLRGNQIYVHNSGANYKGGFTVRNMSVDASTAGAGTVIASVDPIGTLGYTTGGNYSTFNWLIPEKIDNSSWRIYQYCPANGIASYILRDKLSAVNDITVDSNSESAMTVNYSNGVVSISGVAVNTAAIYSLSGMQVAAYRAACGESLNDLNVEHLSSGVYLLRVNNTQSAKFVIK